METLLLIFAGAAVLANWLHTYWVVDYVSNVNEKFKIFGRDSLEVSPKVLQNYLICGVISMAIMALVFLGYYVWAAAACVLEVVVNTYYSYCSYEEKYKAQDQDPGSSQMQRKKRKRVGAYALGVILPLLIYVFTHLYIEVKIYGIQDTRPANKTAKK